MEEKKVEMKLTEEDKSRVPVALLGKIDKLQEVFEMLFRGLMALRQDFQGLGEVVQTDNLALAGLHKLLEDKNVINKEEFSAVVEKLIVEAKAKHEEAVAKQKLEEANKIEVPEKKLVTLT